MSPFRGSSVLLSIVLGASLAYAGSPIRYTFTGTATGTIGATPFSNATLTVTVTSNTSAIVFNGGSSVNYELPYAASTAAFSISGIGSGTFSDSGSINENQAVFGGSVNIYDNGKGLLITMEDDSLSQTALATYALAAAIGPLGPQASNPSVGDWVNVPTSLGNMTVTSESSVTFQASLTGPPTTPVPPSLLLCLIGLAGLTFYMTSRQRRAS